VACRCGDLTAARSLLTESLTMFREIGLPHGMLMSLERLGGLAVARGQMQRAARLHGTAARLRAATGVLLPVAHRHEYEQDLAAVRFRLDEEAFQAAWAQGRTMTLAQAIEYALQDD
jgi:hypothetical protein